jgi:hypothetical protein
VLAANSEKRATTAALEPSEIVSSARLQMIAEYRMASQGQQRGSSLASIGEEDEHWRDSVRPLVSRTRQAAAYKASLMQSFKARRDTTGTPERSPRGTERSGDN